jgi:hypothetical protein
MNIVNWFANLERRDYDDVVGIKITKLAGDTKFPINISNRLSD